MLLVDVIFHVDANFERGMGHLFRTLSLAKVLTARRTKRRILFFGKFSEESRRILTNHSYQFVTISKNSDRNDALRHLLRTVNTGLIINDVLDASEATLKLQRENAAKIICLDDTKYGFQYAHAVINPIVFLKATPATHQNPCPYYPGPSYMVLDSRYTDIKTSQDTWNWRGKRLLVTMGGTDSWDITPKVIRSLSPFFTGEGFHLSVTVGPGFAKRNVLIEWINKFSNGAVTIYSDPPWLGDVMYEHDLIICGGGITLYEGAVLGRPILAIANEPHEVQSIDLFLANGNVLAYVGYRDDWPETRLQELVRTKLSAPEALIRLRSKGLRLVDGKGLERVVDIISYLCGSTEGLATEEISPATA